MTHRLIKNGELVLYGPVGFVSFWDDDGFTANEVIAALAELDGDLTARVNSGGGIAFEGIAIHNALRSYDGKVTIMIDAIAASAASIIAMAGDEIVMRDGAMMMIHDASGITLGNAEDHEAQANLLHKLDGQLSRIYAKKTGKPEKDIRALMDAETWLDEEEAVAQGFATATENTTAEKPTAFDYAIYAHAPERFAAAARTIMTARMPRAEHKAAPSSPKKKESTMDWKDITADALKQHRPDLCHAIENNRDVSAQITAAKTDAATAERDRILGIEKVAMAGHEDIVAEMKADGKTMPGEAAIRVVTAEKEKGARHLQALADNDKLTDVNAAPQPGAGGKKPGEKKTAQTEEGWKAEYQASEDLQSEFGNEGAYVAFQKASKSGVARVKTNVAA